MTDIEILQIKSKKDLKRFIRVANSIYKDDPNYIAPLEIERKEAFQKEKNAFYEHADGEYWLAIRNGNDVGRISAQIDHLAQEKWGPGLGHFGCFEADSPEVAHALLKTAEDWLKSKGMLRMQGPWNLSANQECGMLVEGFETPPVVMMPHGRPQYDNWVKDFGLTGVKDLLAHCIQLPDEMPEQFKRLGKMGERSKKVHIRSIDMKNFDQELKTIIDIFNDAWSENWGYVQLTENEAAHTAKALKPVVKPHRTLICEYDGEPVAFILLVPDVNHFIRDLKGRLFPFGAVKLIWRLLFGKESRIRCPLMGMRKSFQRKPIGAAMLYHMFEMGFTNVRKYGTEFVEMSWVLEDNNGMNNMLTDVGSQVYKRYRIYEKSIK